MISIDISIKFLSKRPPHVLLVGGGGLGCLQDLSYSG